MDHPGSYKLNDRHLQEMLQLLEPVVLDNLNLLKEVGKCWQPTDFVPDSGSEGWIEELKAFRDSAQGVSDELLVVLVGNMITEEALPTYQTWLNRIEGIGDPTGTSDSPWSQWSRGWTAEENRHGDLLNRYLYLTGRVDMRSIEITVQHLIRNGFNSDTGGDLYMSLIYTSFQERATRIAHGNIGRWAEAQGNRNLGRICASIAGDEAKHEAAYKKLVKKVFETDPEGGVLAFQEMMKRNITMPGGRMDDGKTEDLYVLYSATAQYAGVYTIRDYAELVDHLVRHWGIPNLSGLSGEGARAQEFLSRLPARHTRRADRVEREASSFKGRPVPWLFDRRV